MLARSKRDDKQVFEFPEFDKEEYVSKEFRDAKVTGSVILYALIIALLSYSLVRMNRGILSIGLMLIILAELGLKEYFTVLKIDTTAFEKKNWVGSVLLLFFAWFGMFTVLLNPPFLDMVDPHVDSFDLYTITNETSDNVTYRWDDEPNINSTISINATVVDNCKVENVTLSITIPDTTPETRYMKKTGNKDDEYTGGALRLDKEGTYIFQIRVEDNSGNVRKDTRYLVYDGQGLFKLTMHKPGNV